MGIKWTGEPLRSLYDYPARPKKRWLDGFAWGRWLTVPIFLAGFICGAFVPVRAQAVDQHERHVEVVQAAPFASVPDLIRYHASVRGLRPGPLLALAECESGFDPMARGDGGGSHGVYELNELPTGLLRHFVYVGYSDPYDAEQSIEYTARVAAGEFLPGQPGAPPMHPFGIVSLRRWSCFR